MDGDRGSSFFLFGPSTGPSCLVLLGREGARVTLSREREGISGGEGGGGSGRFALSGKSCRGLCLRGGGRVTLSGRRGGFRWLMD